MRRAAAFTLTELLVSVAILVALVLLVSRLFVSAASVTTSGNKRMDSDAQIRPLFERFAIDFAQMVKRSDVDYYLKSASNAEVGNDQIAFYSAVPGYHASSVTPSPISVVAYRVNSDASARGFNKLERMAKALIWNGDAANTPGCDGSTTAMLPLVFLPLTFSTTWPTATSAACDPDYELIAPYVFRFEYYYVLNDGTRSVTPWSTSHTSVNGLQDVTAIAVCIAALDPKSRVLIDENDLTTLASAMNDFNSTMNPGDLLTQWQTALTASTLARPTISAIRLYERQFAMAPRPQ